MLCLPANANDSIYVAKGNLQRLQEELIVSFELNVDKELSRNESVVLIPMIQDSLGHEIELPKIYINSRRQHIMFKRGFFNEPENTYSFLREKGELQIIHYLESIPYSQWMNGAYLVVNEESCGCGLPVSNNRMFTANINLPFSLPEQLPAMAMVIPNETALKIRSEKGSAYIGFPINDTIVDPSFGKNSEELNKIITSIDIIKNDSNCLVTDISIHGYASPEGLYKHNDILSRGRTNAIKEYVATLYDFSHDTYSTEHTPEDWVGFEALLVNSNYVHKIDILKIVNSDIHPDKKEQKIRAKYPQFFQMLLDDWFVILRYADYVIEYEVESYNTIEEIAQVFKTNPYNLSLNELFQLSESHPEDSEERYIVYMTAVVLFPDNPVANLNAACVSLLRREAASARRYLNKAHDCGQKDLAEGVYYMLTKDYEKAKFYLKQAKERGIEEANQYIEFNNSFLAN